MNAALRPPTPDDVPECGRIIYEAFLSIAQKHNFPPDFPNANFGRNVAQMLIGHAQTHGIVAEIDGQVVGSNFMSKRDRIFGIGPITVDPKLQDKGVGRALMEHMLERGSGAAGIRLVHDAFNTVSTSLYAKLGFEIKEPLVVMSGTASSEPPTTHDYRGMTRADIDECAALCERVYGFARRNELADVLGFAAPLVALRGGRIVAYMTQPGFWPMNHAVAETDQDLEALLLFSATAAPISMLVPSRRARLFRFLLEEGVQMVKPASLMAIGEYQEPAGAFHPSVMF